MSNLFVATVESLKKMPSPEDLIPYIRDEVTRRALAKDPDLWVKIKGHEGPKRAILVAAVQGHSVLLIGPSGSGKGMLCEAARQVGVIAHPLDVIPPSLDGTAAERRKAEREMTTKFKKASTEHDMHVEAASVPAKTLLSERTGTDLAYAQRLLKGAVLPPYCKPEQLDDCCKNILKQIIQELGFGNGVIDTIVSVARSVAALDRTAIQVQHIAEAAQYRLLDRLH